MSSFRSVALAGVLLGLSLGALTMPSPAQADDSFLNYILPWIFGEPSKGPKPEDTLQAPFGNEKVKVDASNKLMDIYDAEDAAEHTEGGLALAHRSAEQVGDWVTGIVTQAMTINPETYNDDVKKYTGWFLPYALQEYNAYLGTNQTVETLRSNSMRLTAFAESKPVLVQEGVLEGSYRWLFRVPVMLTYYDLATASLKGRKPMSQTQRVFVNVQVGRIASNKLAEGMAIERWSVVAQ